MSKLLHLLVTFVGVLQLATQDLNDNEIDSGDANPFADISRTLLQSKGDMGGDIGNLISTFMASDSGKQLGDKLLNGGGGASMLQGIAGMMTNGGGGGQSTGELDFDMMANVVNVIGAFGGAASDSKDNGDGFDLGSAFQLAKSFLGPPEGGGKDFMSYLPTILNLLNVFVGPASEQTAREHAGHSWMLPPFIEKLHILVDQLMNSDLGKDVVRIVGAEKIARLFEDDHGRFNYRKFVDLMENHSFRKHWIQMVTSRIAEMLTYIANPYTQKKTMATVQFFLNNFLKSYGVPKHALFDPTRPGETLTALINYMPKRYLGIKVNSAAYVMPAVVYVQDVMRLAENKGYLGRTWSKNELTAKLTDTINMEIIEPLARVNRAIRFAKKVPICTRYVLCVANQHEPEETLSLPGLKKMLANGATFGASWLLSSFDSAPFWSVYGMVQEGKQCMTYYKEQCQDFHVEEAKVTTEYVHNEL